MGDSFKRVIIAAARLNGCLIQSRRIGGISLLLIKCFSSSFGQEPIKHSYVERNIHFPHSCCRLLKNPNDVIYYPVGFTIKLK